MAVAILGKATAFFAKVAAVHYRRPSLFAKTLSKPLVVTVDTQSKALRLEARVQMEVAIRGKATAYFAKRKH
jgi:transposase-like protein